MPPSGRKHGPWTILSSEPVYADPWVNVGRDSVIRPDGQPGTHVTVTIKPGVCVLALDDEGNVFLTDEFHYGVGQNTLEAVSGGIEPGEEPLETARRELREELGIVASEWIDLGQADPFTAVGISPTRLYLARGLAHGSPSPEGTERIRPVRLPLVEAAWAVVSSRITHAPTGVLILKAHWLLNKGNVSDRGVPRRAGGHYE